MNFIDRALEQKLTGDDFLQAMANYYSEPEVENIWNQYPAFVKDVIMIMDYDTTLQMEGVDEVINGSLEERFDDITGALERCGLTEEVMVLKEAKALFHKDPDKYEEKYDELVKRIALHNDYESFWNAVRNYIDKSL